jgi:enoyl-CoA hydratase/carnithine racemase
MLQLTIAEAVATITLDRPPVNAINDAWVAAFHGALDELDGRNDWSVLHIRSAIKVFCGGADLKQIRSNFDRPIDVQVEQGRRFQALFSRIELVSKVTLAEVGGMALGGGLELALACDLRITSTATKLGLPEVGLGLIPGAGGTQRLTRLCGRPTSLRLILAGEIIDGAEAYRLGLAQWCVEPENLAGEAARLAARYAVVPSHALSAAKAAITAATDSNVDGYAIEAESVRTCLESDLTRSLVGRFLNKSS